MQLAYLRVEQVHALPRVSSDIGVMTPIRLEEDGILTSRAESGVVEPGWFPVAVFEVS
jgi:hypothetical protein